MAQVIDFPMQTRAKTMFFFEARHIDECAIRNNIAKRWRHCLVVLVYTFFGYFTPWRIIPREHAQRRTRQTKRGCCFTALQRLLLSPSICGLTMDSRNDQAYFHRLTRSNDDKLLDGLEFLLRSITQQAQKYSTRSPLQTHPRNVAATSLPPAVPSRRQTTCWFSSRCPTSHLERHGASLFGSSGTRAWR